MKRLAIIGSGELGQQIRHYAEIENKFQVVGFFDDYADPDSFVEGLPILGNIKEVLQSYNNGLFDVAFVAIGYKHLSFKKQLFTSLHSNIPFATIISNPTYIDPTAQIGDGVI